MICEHCGSKVVDGGHVCAVCGMATASHAPRPREMAKVVPFRQRKRIPEKSAAKTPAPSRRFSMAMWWIVGIVVIALVAPYLFPLTR